MNSLAENILYIYLIVFISILFFDVVCIFYRKASKIKMKKTESKIQEFINKEDLKNVSLKHINKLKSKLKKTNYLIAFTNIVDLMDVNQREVYLMNLKSVFLYLTPYYERKEVILQTYFVHFLKDYSFIYSDNNNIIIKYLKECTLSSSIYLRETALKALYKIGDINYLREVFFNMNYLNINHHHKLITDGLLTFDKDVDELSKMLIEELDNYNENFKIASINYFNYKKIECQKALYDLLVKDNESKEVKISCIRYFTNVKYKGVVPLLYEFINDDRNNWEYSVVAARALSNYKSKESTEVLIKAIHSQNWFVRNNAAESLIKITSRDYLDKVISKLDDKYAIDALKYKLDINGDEVKIWV